MATIDGNFYSQRKAIVISHTNVGSDLTNFPLCVQIVADTDIGAVCQSTGDDLRFTDADGNLLYAEKESFAVSCDAATGVFWVKVPSLPSTADTTIYCYYGDATASAQTGSTNAWDSNFKGVWHLNDAGNSAINDSTANGNLGTNNGVTAATGQVGNAASFSGSESWLNTSLALDPATYPNVTMLAWAKPYSNSSGSHMVFSFDGSNGGFYRGCARYPSQWSVQTGNSSWTPGPTAAINTWQQIVIVYSAADIKFYYNGVEYSRGSAGAFSTASSIMSIGRDNCNISYPSYSQYWDGLIDEVQISTTARSADWIKFEYYNQKDTAGQLTWNQQESCGSTNSNVYAVSMTCRGVRA